MSLPNLFSPLTLRGQVLKNRIFSTGHMVVMLENGLPTDRMVAYHQARARGGAALIIIEAARAHPSGDSGRPAIRAYDDACIPGYARIAQACQAHGTKVIGQLTHPGREMPMAADGTHAVAYAPSPIPNERFHVMPREMPLSMVQDIIASFGSAAARLRAAGLDGVEVVASHGYLLSQFLNPRLNHRTDAYGGCPENRLRFVAEILTGVRKALGDDMLLGIRLSGDEKGHDGINGTEMVDIATQLARLGPLDYLNVTAGTSSSLAGSTHIVPPMAYEAGYTAPLAAAIRAQVNLPVFVAGRINQPQIAETVLASGQADMCGMTRALIADPLMPTKAKAGQMGDIRACVACNQACIGHMLNGTAISCIQHPETGRELEFGQLAPATTQRRIVVVGGGPAGLKASAVAAARGHSVTLFESQPILGGQVNLAQMLPGRAEFGGVSTNLAHEARQAGVDIRMNTPATRALIEAEAPDAVIIATGAQPYQPTLDMAEGAHIVGAWEALDGSANIGARVVIADWRCDWVGMGLAEKLARDGCHVRLAVNGMTAGQSIPQYARDAWLGSLHRLGVEITPYARLYGADDDCAYFQHTLSDEPILFDDTDTVITALGHRPNADLAEALQDWPGETHLIGDCLSPRTVEEAVLEGLRISATL